VAQNLINVLADSAGLEELEHFQMALEEALILLHCTRCANYIAMSGLAMDGQSAT